MRKVVSIVWIAIAQPHQDVPLMTSEIRLEIQFRNMGYKKYIVQALPRGRACVICDKSNASC